MRVGILTNKNGYERGAFDFYPIMKWQKDFRQEGIHFNFFNSHKNKRLFNQDTVIIDHRYYRNLITIKKKYPDNGFIIELIENLRSKSIRVILFDNGDGAGGRQWDLIKYVDILVKKQLLKDRKEYTKKKGIESYMVFLSGYNLSKEREKLNSGHNNNYTPCPPDQLHKIRLGWNIGMLDYRKFPLSRYYPIGTNRLFNSLYKMPVINTKFDKKNIDSAFRGKVNYKNENYSYQRNKVVDFFKHQNDLNLITGEFIPKNQYLKELKYSKTCISPFGWGEVCYRDFEAIINGCVLIKPDMDHIETWPDIYVKNKTYLSLEWDMSDLKEVLFEVIEQYEDYKKLVSNAQQVYVNSIKSSMEFIRRFKNLID